MGRPAVVHFHDALLAGQDARGMRWNNLNRWETGVGGTPDVVTYSLVAAACLDEGSAEPEADGVLERGPLSQETRGLPQADQA